MRALAAPIAIMLAALLAAACVTMERKPVEKHLYALETARPGGETLSGVPATSPVSVLVRRVQAAPRASGRELVYRTAPNAWSADYYNLFFTPPADMLTQDLRAWLASARLCANVLDPGSLAPAEYILEGNVSGLYGDFAPADGKGPRAVAEMQFLLLKDSGGERRVLLAREYSKSAPLAANTPRALVEGLRQAVSGVYADLEADLRAALAAQPKP